MKEIDRFDVDIIQSDTLGLETMICYLIEIESHNDSLRSVS
jgi:hypothetical protein